MAAVLLTGGGGAFAVASLGPDAANLPTKLVSYPVESLAENLSLEALEAPGFSLYRSEQTRSSDTAESLLQRMGVADPAAAAFLRADNTVRQNLLGRAGRLVSWGLALLWTWLALAYHLNRETIEAVELVGAVGGCDGNGIHRRVG